MQIAAGPQMDIGKEMALRELESQALATEQVKGKTALAEAAKPPAQQIGELAAAKSEAQSAGELRARLKMRSEARNSPEYTLGMEAAKTDYKRKLAEIAANPNLPPEERAKLKALADKALAAAPDSILDELLGPVLYSKPFGIGQTMTPTQ
jgi:hypothetical protein